MGHHPTHHHPQLLSMKDEPHTKTQRVKVYQDSPPLLAWQIFFPGEQQVEGHGAVKYVEGEYHEC